MIRAMLIDDELSARKTLRSLLQNYTEDIELVGEADSVKSALEQIPILNPELVFLDIELRDGTGFNVLESLDAINFHIVFTTAFEQYALRSFRFAAIDYLLKPIKIAEFQETIKRVRSRAVSEIGSGAAFMEAKKKVDSFKATDDAVVISEISGFTIMQLNDVLYCEGDKNYTAFYMLSGKTLMATRTLGEYEDLLVERGFMRIQKSFLVNLSKVTRYLKGRGGEIELVNGVILPLSRNRKQIFIDYFTNRFGAS